MNTDLTNAASRAALAGVYRDALLDDVMPFWLKHGMDREHGGIMTAVDRDGTVVDTDKSVWFQGRTAWMFATLHNTVADEVTRRTPVAADVRRRTATITAGESASSPRLLQESASSRRRLRKGEWLEAARSCVEFLRAHCFSPGGKMYFTVTREGRPLRMRRYVFSESFAAIAFAAFAQATGDQQAAEEAQRCFATYLQHSFTPGVMPPKFEATRPMKGIGPHMIGIATAQELRANLGDVCVSGRSCTEWIDFSIAEIERDFLKPEHQALLENVAPDGSVIDHFDGRTLNPGHALECAWFLMHEGRLRGDKRLIGVGTQILDWMWARGWDNEFGGLLYFTDLKGLPVQEYWQDMKFWWPHNEAIIATLLAWKLTGEARYAAMHRLAHDWSFQHFPDPEFGEWFGYLRRDGKVASRAKGTLWKGPFHLPRMLWFCARELAEK